MKTQYTTTNENMLRYTANRNELNKQTRHKIDTSIHRTNVTSQRHNAPYLAANLVF